MTLHGGWRPGGKARVTEGIARPLYDGKAALQKRNGSHFTHVMCDGRCRSEFLIGATAMRVLGHPERAPRRERISRTVALPVPENRVHVVAWSTVNDDAELSVQKRDAWMKR